MKSLVKVFLLIIVLAGVTACEKQILYSDLAPEPVLVVNGIQHVGQPAQLVVEKSSFYMGLDSVLSVREVKADLFVNGVFKESLHVVDTGYYDTYEDWATGELVQKLRYSYTYCEGSYILCEGDVLRFEVSSPEFEDVAVAETTMPFAPNVIAFDTVRTERLDDYGDMAFYFSLKIDDPEGKNYYNIYPQGILDPFVSSDPVFTDFMEVIQIGELFEENEFYGRGPFNMFDDTYFDGREYAVSLNTSIWGVEPNNEFTLEVSCLDAPLYKYQRSYDTYEFGQGGLLEYVTEPVQVYSNVENGVGVVAGQSQPVVMTININLK